MYVGLICNYVQDKRSELAIVLFLCGKDDVNIAMWLISRRDICVPQCCTTAKALQSKENFSNPPNQSHLVKLF